MKRYISIACALLIAATITQPAKAIKIRHYPSAMLYGGVQLIGTGMVGFGIVGAGISAESQKTPFIQMLGGTAGAASIMAGCKLLNWSDDHLEKIIVKQ